jgi:hypothetical protein
MKLRLKAIIQDADFRYNELNMYEQYRKTKAFTGDPGRNEAFLFVSKRGNQLVWILNYEPGVLVQKTERKRIESLRMRVSGGYWNPLMLANYALAVGIELEGIKRFEEAFAARKSRKK